MYALFFRNVGSDSSENKPKRRGIPSLSHLLRRGGALLYLNFRKLRTPLHFFLDYLTCYPQAVVVVGPSHLKKKPRRRKKRPRRRRKRRKPPKPVIKWLSTAQVGDKFLTFFLTDGWCLPSPFELNHESSLVDQCHFRYNVHGLCNLFPQYVLFARRSKTTHLPYLRPHSPGA